MPVVISLLNAFTGTAVGDGRLRHREPGPDHRRAPWSARRAAILTKLMADAMNRSILNIMVGGFGGGEGALAVAGAGGGAVREIAADDAAIQLAYAQKVIIVPGYGLAVAQAQHAGPRAGRPARGARRRRQVRHPPGGRPDARPHERAAGRGQRALPAAQGDGGDQPRVRPLRRGPGRRRQRRDQPGGAPARATRSRACRSSTSTTPSRSSSSSGRWATATPGIDNELYTDPKTGMLFADAKDGLQALTSAVKAV